MCCQLLKGGVTKLKETVFDHLYQTVGYMCGVGAPHTCIKQGHFFVQTLCVYLAFFNQVTTA